MKDFVHGHLPDVALSVSVQFFWRWNFIEDLVKSILMFEISVFTNLTKESALWQHFSIDSFSSDRMVL
jgi:hypothetical protein